MDTKNQDTSKRKDLEKTLRSYDIMSEAIALSSPSGRMSKRARKAAEERLSRMIGDLGDLRGQAPEPTLEEKKKRLTDYASYLRDLASRGFQPRKMLKEAARLDEQALTLK